MNSNLVEFGEYLKIVREDYGYTLSKLSEEIGYSTSYLSQIEKGRRKKPATIDLLKELSLAIETPYSKLLLKAGYEELAEGQYYKEMFANIKIVRTKDILNTNKNNKSYEDIKNISKLMNIHINGIIEWAKDHRFNEDETIRIIEHFNEMLLKYKEVVQKMVSANQKWNTSENYLTGIWSEDVTKESIKQIFLKVELEKDISDLTDWIDNLPDKIL